MQTEQKTRRYRYDIPKWVIWDRRLEKKAVAALAGVSGPTLDKVLRGGNVEIDTLWKVVDTLRIKRQAMTDFKLKERDFESAVLNGGSTRRVGR